MAKEVTGPQLQEMCDAKGKPWLHQLEIDGMKMWGWRCFALDEAEEKRLAIIADNLSHEKAFNVQIRLLARLSGISENRINSYGTMQESNVVTIVVKEPGEPRLDAY